MKVLVFDIWADYAHFRKFYTTSSPLTFSFPPPSTLAGILGAIYGSGKGDYLKIFNFDDCKLAVRILSPVKKVRMEINLINTKGNYWVPYGNRYHEPRTQIRTEFLKDPCFRIYYSHEDSKIFEELRQLITTHQSIYTVSLGLSELLADFKYLGLLGSEVVSGVGDKIIEISTPVVFSNLLPDGLEIETGKKYCKEKIPIVMNSKRIVEKYDDVIFEPDGKTLKARVKTYYKLENEENITFF